MEAGRIQSGVAIFVYIDQNKYKAIFYKQTFNKLEKNILIFNSIF